MTRNRGHLPPEAVGKRVRVRLRNGVTCDSWPADGRGGCRWTLTGDTHDILAYQVIA